MKQGNSLSTEQQWIFTQTRRPREEDPGAIEPGYFSEENARCSCAMPLAREPVRVKHCVPVMTQQIAQRLLRDETGQRRWSDFNRPLRDPKIFYESGQPLRRLSKGPSMAR